jgi:hypothetical protein
MQLADLGADVIKIEDPASGATPADHIIGPAPRSTSSGVGTQALRDAGFGPAERRRSSPAAATRG